MIAQHLDGLAIGHSVHLLEDTDPEQQHQFNGGASVIRTIAVLQGGPCRCQLGVNQLAEQSVAVSFGKQSDRKPCGREELRLGGEAGQAHKWVPARAGLGLEMALRYGLVFGHASTIPDESAGDSVQESAPALLRQYPPAGGRSAGNTLGRSGA